MASHQQHFQRGGKGVFTCCNCGRQTRHVDQSVDSEACPQCWDLSGCQNEQWDGYDVNWSFVDAQVAAAVKHGGSLEKIHASFSDLFAARPVTQEQVSAPVATKTGYRFKTRMSGNVVVKYRGRVVHRAVDMAAAQAWVNTQA
jgi:hypothetical protein